jgi:hypothetical protein
VLLASRAAPGIINPKFTPKDLVEQSSLVAAGTLQKAGADGAWAVAVGRVLKGDAGKTQTLSLAECNEDQVGSIRETFKENVGKPVMLFIAMREQGRAAYAHVSGRWLAAKHAGGDRWLVTGDAPNMPATYAGGTDMLIRMSEYLLKDPDPTVPVSAGVRWADEPVKVGRIAGPGAGLAAVEFGEKRRLHLYVACTKGDRLFHADTDPDELVTTFQDVTAATGLKAKSRRFTWMDVNGDGRADLVTWDGADLSVRAARADGTLADAGKAWTVRLNAECTGLAPCSPDGTPGLLVSTPAGPTLLLAAKGGGWRRADLPDAPGPVGTTAPCIAADLDLDGHPDLLQPGAQAGLLWKGKPGGFQKPVRSPVCSGGGYARFAVGDFNADGAPDILLAGTRRNSLWENDGKGGFRDVFEHSGSMSYKCPPNAAEVRAMDLNHDGRTDLCFAYARDGIVYHFNRGFRAFGEEGEVKLPGLRVEIGRPRIGVLGMSVADYDQAGSQDLVVLCSTGEIQAYLNDQMYMPGVRLRLRKGVTGPVTASCWQGEEYPVCVGLAVVTGHGIPARVPARFAGPVTVRWTVPGRGVQKKKVTLEDTFVDVVLEPVKQGG